MGLILLAWIHRLLFLHSNSDAAWGFSVLYEGDSETFYNYARAILADMPYDGGVPFHPPAFPKLLSFVHSWTGAGAPGANVSHTAVKTVVALIGSIPVGLSFLLIRPFLGVRVALLSALLCLYSFGLYVIAVAPVSESMYLTLLLGALLVWTRGMTHPLAAPTHSTAATWRRLGAGLVLGLILGVLALTRAEGVLPGLFLFTIGILPAVRRPQKERAWAPWALVVLGSLLVIAPWTARNADRLSQINAQLGPQLAEPLPTFVPITIYGPLNFALANNEMANGTFSREYLASGVGAPVLNIRDPQHLEFFLHGYSIGWEFIRTHPGEFVALVGKKWGLFLGSLKLGWTQWNIPGGLVGVRHPVDLFIPNSSVGLWILVPLILGGLGVGLVGLRRSAPKTTNPDKRERTSRAGLDPLRRWTSIVLIVTTSGLATAGLFFGYARLGVILLPFWFSLAALFILRTASSRSKDESFGDLLQTTRLGRAERKWILAILVGMFLLEGWGAIGNRDYVAKGQQIDGQEHLNPHETMYLEVIPGR